jgi:hypothetical protein
VNRDSREYGDVKHIVESNTLRFRPGQNKSKPSAYGASRTANSDRRSPAAGGGDIPQVKATAPSKTSSLGNSRLEPKDSLEPEVSGQQHALKTQNQETKQESETFMALKRADEAYRDFLASTSTELRRQLQTEPRLTAPEVTAAQRKEILAELRKNLEVATHDLRVYTGQDIFVESLNIENERDSEVRERLGMNAEDADVESSNKWKAAENRSRRRPDWQRINEKRDNRLQGGPILTDGNSFPERPNPNPDRLVNTGMLWDKENTLRLIKRRNAARKSIDAQTMIQHGAAFMREERFFALQKQPEKLEMQRLEAAKVHTCRLEEQGILAPPGIEIAARHARSMDVVHQEGLDSPTDTGEKYQLTLLLTRRDAELGLDTSTMAPLTQYFPADTDIYEARDNILSNTRFRAVSKASRIIPVCCLREGAAGYYMVLPQESLEMKYADDGATRARLVFKSWSEILKSSEIQAQGEAWYELLEGMDIDPLVAVMEHTARARLRKRVEFYSAEDSQRIDEIFHPETSVPHHHSLQVQKCFAAYDKMLSDTVSKPTKKEISGPMIQPAWIARGIRGREFTLRDKYGLNLELEMDKNKDLVESLWDTGASTNFVENELVERYQFAQRVCPQTRYIRLADKSLVSANVEALVPLAVLDRQQRPTVMQIWCLVMDQLPSSIIIGLPTLISRMSDCFIDHLKGMAEEFSEKVAISEFLNVATAVEDGEKGGDAAECSKASTGGKDAEMGIHSEAPVQDPFVDQDVFIEKHALDPEQNLADYAEFMARHDAKRLVHTWKDGPPEVAPEDDEPYPMDFPEHLYFSEMTVEEAEIDFMEKYPSRLGAEARAIPRVHEVMKDNRRAFIPQSWEGIKDIVFTISWKKDMPDMRKPRARPINPKLFANVEKEFKRLCTYMYEPYDGPIASPLAVAPRATSPFIRICGDYREINTWVESQHGYIPDVKKLLGRLRNAKYYLDIDLSNAFHQIRLAEESANKLSLATPWGQVRPRFLPEGVKPASHQLQKTVNEIFAPLADDAILAFDNILLMADTMDKAVELLEKVLKLCIDRNVYLKLSKSNIIVQECTFFSYKVTPQGLQMGDALKGEIKKIPFPETQKRVRSFVGSTVYYSTFIPNYSTLIAPIIQMGSDQYWKGDHLNPEIVAQKKAAFARYMVALENEMMLAYPDYSLPWTLRTDASTYGIGAVLFQTKIDETTGEEMHQPLYFISQVFSKQAQKWSTIEQEAYAIYYALKQLEYYLIGKPVVIETDHANLAYLEQSQVPKLVRWRIYIQSFITMVKHVPGPMNKTADWLSRLFIPREAEHLLSCASQILPNVDEKTRCSWYGFPTTEWIDMLKWSEVVQTSAQSTGTSRGQESIDILAAGARVYSWDEILYPKPEVLASTVAEDEDAATNQRTEPSDGEEERLADKQMIAEVHTARRGHMGVFRTWAKLGEQFPGHKIPYAFVEEYVATCPTCQKFRLGRGRAYYKPAVRFLPADDLHSAVGVDLIELNEDNGYKYICCIVCHFSKMVRLFPIKDKEAVTVAKCLFKFYAQVGVYDLLRCDQGSEFTSQVCRDLHKYLGIDIKYSIVRRHESSGVERTNREVRRHLIALIADERKYGNWSDDSVLTLAEYVINNESSVETGQIPVVLQNGSEAASRHRLPEGMPSTPTHEYVQRLDAMLQDLRETSRRYHARIQEQRAATEKMQNMYVKGDLVLFDSMTLGISRDKTFDARWKGPYVVEKQVDNTVYCEHATTKTAHEFHVSEMKLFAGTIEQAEQVGRFDSQQFQVEKILSHTGDHLRPMSMSFSVQFADGEVLDTALSADLRTCQVFVEYCNERVHLRRLLHVGEARTEYARTVNAKAIPEHVAQNLECWVNLQCYNSNTFWYDKLRLPGQPSTEYWTRGTFNRAGRGWEIILNMFRPVFHQKATGAFVHEYVLFKQPAKGVVVDRAFADEHPQLLDQYSQQDQEEAALEEPAQEPRRARRRRARNLRQQAEQHEQPEREQVIQALEGLETGMHVYASQRANAPKTSPALILKLGQQGKTDQVFVRWIASKYPNEWLPATNEYIEIPKGRRRAHREDLGMAEEVYGDTAWAVFYQPP